MPELAEVEYYRKQWDPGLGGQIESVHTHSKARIFREAPAAAVRKGLTGRSLVSSFAHGKQLLFQFSGGAWLGIHLGMTGKLFSEPIGYREEKKDHLVLLQSDRVLVFSDYRMFGKVTIDVTDTEEPPEWWQSLPAQVLDKKFTRETVERFVNRFPRTPLKTLLLDQRGFPGIGNWMADEICWRLKIRPSRLCSELSLEEIHSLWKEIRQVSRNAMRVIGTDWNAPPDSWLFNHRWKNGGNCPRCDGELLREDLRGRTTCWCPACQK